MIWIWDFLKKRWFSAALVVLLLLAFARKNLRINVGGSTAPAPKEQPEKYTREKSIAQGSSLLNLGADETSGSLRLSAPDDATAMAFLKRFSQVAVAEQKKFGMPASVLLACAYVNSFAGRRDCTVQANNYLAVRCSADWGGPVVTCAGACYRQYNTPWESIRDFNVQLSKREWYAHLKKSAKNNWRAWLKTLAEKGASDVVNFEGEAVKVIQKYRLDELD
ncbi:MAG: glucosaminidase domain-containing protein [Thermoanaerobaculia bacterium]|nr:glucosaminidase domain-containing protein [Thermoanaerobaculia bacterium]